MQRHEDCSHSTYVLSVAQRLATCSLFVFLFAAGCDCRGLGPECRNDTDCDDGLSCTVDFCSRTGRRGTCENTPVLCPTFEVCDEASGGCVPCSGSSCFPDGGPPDAGLRCEELVSGASCSGPRACGSSECQEAMVVDWASSVRPDGTPGRSFPMSMFPGGYCSVRCDARRLNDECGDCADCNGDLLAGYARLPLYYAAPTYETSDGVCRETCTPTPTGRGCARDGYTCDPETSTCMEACVDDRQCQIVFGDFMGDGSYRFLDRGEGHPAYCDRTTGRCRTRGTPGTSVGDVCTDESDCPDDAICLLRPGRTEGVCTIPGCRAPGFECEPPAVCDERNLGAESSGCLLPCRVGAEDGTPAMRGSRTGGNPDCGPGLACSWNGVAEAGDALTGSCVPGVYTDRATPNVGAPCTTNDDCDSPFGYGECIFSSLVSTIGSGICTVRHCGTFLGASGEPTDGLLPGVEIAAPICDASRGEVCMNLGSDRFPAQTYCLESCEDGRDCAPGYACAQLLGGGARFCWPYCFEDRDCGPDADCEGAAGSVCPIDSVCFCSDRTV
jgi:hypothetical protein